MNHQSQISNLKFQINPSFSKKMFAKILGISTDTISNKLFTIFGAVILLSIFIGVATDFYFLAAVPVVALIGFIAIVDFIAAVK